MGRGYLDGTNAEIVAGSSVLQQYLEMKWAIPNVV
jgi:hypothetical protein